MFAAGENLELRFCGAFFMFYVLGGKAAEPSGA